MIGTPRTDAVVAKFGTGAALHKLSEELERELAGVFDIRAWEKEMDAITKRALAAEQALMECLAHADKLELDLLVDQRMAVQKAYRKWKAGLVK